MQDTDIITQQEYTQVLANFVLKTGVKSKEARTILTSF